MAAQLAASGPLVCKLNDNPRATAVVISDVYGQRGGAYRVTSLLCEMLCEMDVETTCFSTWVDTDSHHINDRHRLVRPWISRGYRWDLPNRAIAKQAARYIRRAKPTAVFAIGLTKLCGYLLNSTVADRLYVWELTNAEPGNKFVSSDAAESLYRARAVLSPALTIDQSIRSTYQYQGKIQRLPFWIEDDCSGYSEQPQSFTTDFLFLARREDDKGLRELIQATALLVTDMPNLRVLIGGPGDESRYQNLARELKVDDCITFRALPSRIDAMNTLAASRYMVLPSYHEGYPLSLLEAAQKSVPFITTDVGAIRDVFSACEGCTIVAPRDTQALFHAMRNLMNATPNDYRASRIAVYKRFEALSSRSSVHAMLHELLSAR